MVKGVKHHDFIALDLREAHERAQNHFRCQLFSCVIKPQHQFVNADREPFLRLGDAQFGFQLASTALKLFGALLATVRRDTVLNRLPDALEGAVDSLYLLLDCVGRRFLFGLLGDICRHACCDAVAHVIASDRL